MDTGNSHLKRLLALSALVGVAVLMVSGFVNDVTSLNEATLFGGAMGEGGEGRSQDDDFRMFWERDDPQPNGVHWSIYVIMEEKDGEIWNKTTRDINAQIIFYNDSEEDIIIDIDGTDGFGFVLINLSYELPVGEYTVRAKAKGVDMDWKKDVLSIPLTSRPPYAVAKVIVGEDRLKEAILLLDREHKASVTFDSSESWDPDLGETELINYTWTIGDTTITSRNTSLHWTFTEAGDYLIMLRAEDPSKWNMYSDDWVTVHVQEVLYQSDLRVSIESDLNDVEVGEEISVTALIENIGNEDAWGFDANFFNRDGAFMHQRIGLIPYGTNRTISFDYTPVREGQDWVQIHVDPTDEISERDETNNEAAIDLIVRPKPLPKVAIETFAVNGSFEAEKLTFITIILKNTGTINAQNVRTVLYINSELVVEEIFESVGAGEKTTVVYTWSPKEAGTYNAHVVVWIDSVIHDNQYVNGIEITPPPSEPAKKDGIPMEFVAVAGFSIFLIIGAIGISGIENTKYKLLGSMVMVPLYTRLKKEDTLNHHVRARVYEHIVSHPGDSYASILHSLELKNGTLVHHLRTLERERYVKSKKDGKYKRFYPWGTKVGERDPHFLTDIQTDIVGIIESSPGVSQANIANSLHRSRQSVNYQVKILADAGLINVIKHGISTRCYMMET